MIIPFWNLPEDRNYIVFNKKFKDELIKILKDKGYPSRILTQFKNKKIKIKLIKSISEELSIDYKLLERNVSWIGGNNSKGLSNPKHPFNLSNRNGARFIAAIINDGCITKNDKRSYGRLMYDNFDKTIRESVIRDYLNIFGGKPKEISFRDYEKKKFLEFPSVVRDIMELILKDKGSKCESNIKIPGFILEKKESMLGWIEQTIADEGEIKYYPKKYRRSIIWRRSLDISNILNKKIKDTPLRKLSPKLQKVVQDQKCQLIEGEKKILDSLGIPYKSYNLGIYRTSKDKIRTRWQISITKRENLLKLRKLIKIPSIEKDKKFTRAVKEFVRYKEPLRIRKTIVDICKKKKRITSNDLQKAMNYKQISNACQWLKRFEREGLIKMVEKPKYGGEGKQKSSAKYILILNK